jgi:hypothetical protein
MRELGSTLIWERLPGAWRVEPAVKCLSSSPLGAASALSRTHFHPSLKLEGRSRSGIEDRCMFALGMVTRAEQALVVWHSSNLRFPAKLKVP